ncbi:MAG: lysophospholipid acyltransferase family protein [Leptospira sp.]|nr:lysophospholipid acyltransferase family protein [Leptospira sp.]
MFRTLSFYIFFFTRGLFSFIARWKARRVNLPNVEESDWAKNTVPRSWSKTLLWIVGANVSISKETDLPSGPVLFVSNHEGNFDIPTLISSLPKPFGFISKIEVLKIPVVGSWMKIMNCVFLDRTNRNDSTKAMATGVSVLKEGHSLLIFPEGTRSKGGAMRSFKAGSFRLAMDAGVPIVPIAIKGTSNIMEKNNSIMKPADVKVKILSAIPFSEFEKLSSKEIAERVENQIKNALIT